MSELNRDIRDEKGKRPEDIIYCPTSSFVERIQFIDENTIKVYYRSGMEQPFIVSKEMIDKLRYEKENWERLCLEYGEGLKIRNEQYYPLLAENKNLVYRIHELEEENGHLDHENALLRTKNKDLINQNQQFRRDNKRLNNRRVELAEKLENKEFGE